MTRQKQVETRASSTIDCALREAERRLDFYAEHGYRGDLDGARVAYDKAENVAYVICDGLPSPWPSFEDWSGWYLAAARGESS